MKFDLSLFDKPSEKSKSKSNLRSSMIKPSKNFDYSAGKIFNNFNETREKLGSSSSKDFKFAK